MKYMYKTIVLLLCLFFFSATQAQVAEKEVDHSYKPLTLKLDEDGSKYVRFIMWHQLWMTTNNLETEDAKLTFDPSIRRSRFLAFAQISPRFLFLTHFGLNSLGRGNLSTLGNTSDAAQFFLHDAWGEIKVTDELYIGSGLHYWKGLTRLANQSTLNFMTLDQARPFTHWHSLGITDQFARHLGIYAKGAIGKFDYRIAMNGPGNSALGDGRDYGTKGSTLSYTGSTTADAEGNSTGNKLYEGYFRYNFWDKESTKLPYQVGTYMGKKKVFGIGAGFFAHPNGMVDTLGSHSNVSHVAVDAFLDMPIGTKGQALNAYASFINFDYGDDYVSRWAGTGTNLYAHLGYYLGKSKLMPYVAVQQGNYDGYDDPIGSMDIGVNYFLNGHHCKITAEYHRINGDVREGAIATQEDALSQFRVQFHVFL